MPLGNREAMIHYEDTIRKKVPAERISPYIDTALARRLDSIFGRRPIAVWGSRDSNSNQGKFDRMNPGDEVLIVEGDTVRLLGRVAAKTVNPKLSRELWKNIHGNSTEGWDLIYFIANPREIGIPFTTVCRLLGYSHNYPRRGFTAVSEETLKAFYSVYDDLYSILIAEKEGMPIQKLPQPIIPYPKVEDQLSAAAESASDEVGTTGNNEVSEHTKMQWLLLRMGRQAGEKVWAPKNDQARIAEKYQFTDFETTFASGLDTQVKYVENIDVVWKEEFRIDAAFEIENSTAIYSGLLRFADLTMVAPNTSYPMFIVAPDERRNRVREQLIRPSFQRLKIAEKVRFLPYSKVNEIDDFIGPEGKGLSVELFTSKSEKFDTARRD